MLRRGDFSKLVDSDEDDYKSFLESIRVYKGQKRPKRPKGKRSMPNKKRVRLNWKVRVASLTDEEFQVRYR